MKLLAVLTFCSLAVAARADEGKSSPRAQAKMSHEARVYVLDKEAPSVDKTVRLEHPRPALKDKS